MRHYLRFIMLASFVMPTNLFHATSSAYADEAPSPEVITDISTALDNTLLDDDHVHGEGDIKHNRPDTHAPGGLMGDHVHARGEYMIEYKYMNMYMAGNRAGSTRLTPSQAMMFDGFMVAPTQMTMEMHMAHFMYGYTDNITMYIMPMWKVHAMDHVRMDTTTFRTVNAGAGDLPFGALWRIRNGASSELIANIGFSAPTGDIDNLAPTGSEFPYPMRLGAGTWNARPGITYKGYREQTSLGIQFQTDIPMGLNKENYAVGNDYRLNAWYAHRIGSQQQAALTFRVECMWQNNFSGADPDLMMMANMVPTARPNYQGGEWVNLGYGTVWSLPDGSRLNFEIAHPVHQHLEGVQLEIDWSLTGSWSKGF